MDKNVKNVLLIMTDQQRSDYVGYIPNGKADMPNLDQIAHHAHFTNCQTSNPICTPARTSLITGRYSRQIGTLTMSGDLFPQIPTMMQALQQAGYKTYGIGKFHYLQTHPWDTKRGRGMQLYDMAMDDKTQSFGYDFVWETAGKQQLDKCYDFYAKYLDDKGMLEEVRDFMFECGGTNGDTANHNYDKALPWPFSEEDYVDVVTGRVAAEQLKKHDANIPFFMKVSFCGPHKPYDAPQRYLDMFPLERNDDFILGEDQTLNEAEKEILYRQRRSTKAMLKLIDDQIGILLDILASRGMDKNTLIVFTSDHGDMLGDHYMIQKGVPWRQSLNVPLAIKAPGIEPIGMNPSPVELTDITATILDWAGLSPQSALSRTWPAYNDLLPCRSLLPILKGEVPSVREFAFSETDFTEERSSGITPEEIVKNRGGRGRTNAWQCITTETTKYIKYLGYNLGDDPVEEFYDLSVDPEELHDLSGDENYKAEIEEARKRLMYIIDHYPPAQKTWAENYVLG